MKQAKSNHLTPRCACAVRGKHTQRHRGAANISIIKHDISFNPPSLSFYNLDQYSAGIGSSVGGGGGGGVAVVMRLWVAVHSLPT